MREEFLDAVKSGQIKKVEALLEEDASLVNATTVGGNQATLLALYNGRPEIAELLVKRKARLDIFSAAAVGDLVQVIDLVEKNPSLINGFAKDGFHPLGLSCFFGQLTVAEYLISKGATINRPSNNPQKVTPLHSAAAARQVTISRGLLEAGADPNAKQAGEFTPLHAASQNGQLELVKLLLQFGADPQIKNTDGWTAIDFAHFAGQSEVELLLKTHYKKSLEDKKT